MSAALARDEARVPDARPGEPLKLVPPAAPRPPQGASMRWVVAAVSVALTAASVLVSAVLSEGEARRAIEEQMRARLLVTARNLALAGSPALLNDYPELTLHPLVSRLHAANPEFSWAAVTDRAGIVFGHRDAARLGSPLVAPPGLRPARGAGLEAGEALFTDRSTIVVRVPVRHPRGQVLGTVWVGLDRSFLDRTTAHARQRQGVAFAALALLAAFASFMVMSGLLRPFVALRNGIERIGRGDLGHRIALRDRTEMGMLAASVDDMASRLQAAQREVEERVRLAHEVEIARGIQQSLLPSKPFLEGGFTVVGSQRAAAEVGGDYYEVLPLSDGTVAVAIADVSGKGLAGCLVMSMLSVLLRALREQYRSPSALLIALDTRLTESLQRGQFVTMFYGILDPRSGRMTFASAGHNDLLVYRAATRRVERVEERGVPLAALRGGAIRASLQDHEISLGVGDALLQFTDGYSEAFDPTRTRQFGVDQLAERFAALAPGGPSAVLDGLAEAVARWRGDQPPLDDETLLVVAREPAGSERPPVGPPSLDHCTPETAMALLDAGEFRGKLLRMPAHLDVLAAIRSWTQDEAPMRDLPAGARDLLNAALYEVSANVAEHGYRGQPAGMIELWWVPVACPADDGSESPRTGSRCLTFVVRDHAQPFHPGERSPVDFEESAARRRGRGLGLDIIRRVMAAVHYVPNTARGNLTVLRFDDRAIPGSTGDHQ